ncbi:flagellar hook-associated 2-like protein [Salinisphaera dokdonensis CL-ES53]|uniref:Flagellar hook-associated protein 2 n=1 Tax=Salinisphaera dokdonensis CL-ES53 TaxID=1304272 RepID=A0ABV2AYE4_9GAMM
MAVTSSLGIGSGLDLSSLLDGLKSAEQQRLVPLQTRASSYNTKLSAYGTLQSTLSSFQSAAETLGDPALFQGVKTSSDSESFTASAGSDAAPGSYSLEVGQLARRQSLVSDGQVSTDDTIGSGGKITLSLGDGAGNSSASVDIELAAGDSSLSGIRDAINAADIGISASIVNDGSDTPYRLVLSSDATGTDSQISVSVAESNDDGSTPLGDLLAYDSDAASGAMQQSVAARNAKLSVNGIAISSQSNTVEEAIQGVTLTLTGETTEPQTLTASRDTGTVKSALQKFVSAYNRVNTLSDNLTAFDSESNSQGVLLGDSTARTAEARVRSALNTPIAGGAFSGLAEIGISLQRDGTMEIDEEALDDALANNLAGVSQLLAGSGETDGLSQVLVSTLETVAGDEGLLQSASDGVRTRIDGLSDRMEREQESIDATIARYQKQFVQLDSIMAQLNSTSNYLTQQFESLSKQND